jgi:hypothetical protein
MMDSSDATALVFLAHFQESRLKETKQQVESTDTRDCDYLRVSMNNPLLSAEMDKHRRAMTQHQNDLDRLFVQTNTTWTQKMIAEFIHGLELYQDQPTVSRWIRAWKAVNDLSTQILYIRTQNEELRKRATETKRVKK